MTSPGRRRVVLLALKAGVLHLVLLLLLREGVAATNNNDDDNKADFTHAISSDAFRSKFAFGSCNKQHPHTQQPLWATIDALDVDGFFWTGDAVYPNRTDITALERALDDQRRRPEYAKIVTNYDLVVDGTWDDHDLGLNDAGKGAPGLDARRRAFVDFLTHNSDDDGPKKRRAKLAETRRGTYVSRRFEVESFEENMTKRSAVVIFLDCRSFRESYLIPSVGGAFRNVPVVGRLMPLVAAATRVVGYPLARYFQYAGDVLGTQQWQWFESQLQIEADFHVVVSSIQFATSNPSFESWAHFPRARDQFASLVKKTHPKGLVLLSGDVHHADLATFQYAKDDDDVTSFPEVTSSGMTHTLQTSRLTRLLFPPLLAYFSAHRPRPDDYATVLNFGLLDFDWTKPALTVTVRGRDGKPLLRPLLVTPDAFSFVDSDYYSDDDDDDDVVVSDSGVASSSGGKRRHSPSPSTQKGGLPSRSSSSSSSSSTLEAQDL